MYRLAFALLLTLSATACNRPDPPVDPQRPDRVGKPPQNAEESISLVEARKGFKTQLSRKERDGTPAAEPPKGVFQKLKFPAPLGAMTTYLTPDPGDGKQHPAIIWITGGDCNTIGEVWEDEPPSNDQSAAAYRKEKIVMMFPSLRGGNDNPGVREGFLGEVDDILAAEEFLAKQKYVDPKRIYLGGHSTGGTLVLLTAECTDRFRAVFSFGPADDVSGYPPEYAPFNRRDPREVELRSPIRWMHAVKSPVFVFEGRQQGNIPALQAMQRRCTNPKLSFYIVERANHFSLLAPVNAMIAKRILRDDGPTCNLAFTAAEVNAAMGR